LFKVKISARVRVKVRDSVTVYTRNDGIGTVKLKTFSAPSVYFKLA